MVAEIFDMVVINGQPKVEKVWGAVDCGIVVNRDSAKEYNSRWCNRWSLVTPCIANLLLKMAHPTNMNFGQYSVD